MAYDFDELDINPFYKALQTRFLDMFERAQDCCYIICVPQTDSFNHHTISTDFAETHILRPSPYFKGQYLTTHSSNKKTLKMTDNNQSLITMQGFPEEKTVKIVTEELAYNRDYKQYRILILDGPLNPKFGLKNYLKEDKKFKQLMTPKLSVKECTDFLLSIPEFKEAIDKLDRSIEYFCRHYMVLPDYLDDAVDRLQEISEDALKIMIQYMRKTQSSDPKFIEVVAGAVESYLMNAVFPKVFTVICQRHATDDQILLCKCQKLNKVKAEQIGVRKEFACPLPEAVVELANIGSLQTPREKLACLKSTVDNITEGISLFIRDRQTVHLAGIVKEEDEPVITTDDLIPILVMVIAQAKCHHLHSDLFYMEHFIWDSMDKDRDDSSYCLVSVKAAVQYMMTTDFSHLREQESNPQKELALDELMSRASLGGLSGRSARSALSSDMSGSGRLERQLARISGILEKTEEELGLQKHQQREEQKIQSIFGSQPARVPKIVAPPPDLIPPQERMKTPEPKPKEQLGDFLSALQDDFDLEFGKQT